jgi:hypothetical protein
LTYSQSHFLLTIVWFPTAYPAESGQVGLRFHVPGVSPAQAIADGCRAPVSTFWSSAGSKIPSSMQLRYVRLARIGTDGHYASGTISYDALFTAATAGASPPKNPLQVAAATTLATSVPKGAAALGRIFLPEIASDASQTYWTDTDVDARSTAVATMLSSLGTVLGGPCIVASQGTQRHPTPISRAVTHVYTGKRVDVQRRRAKSLVEIKGASKTVTLPAGGDPGEIIDPGLP